MPLGTSPSYVTAVTLASTPVMTAAAVLAGGAGAAALWRTSEDGGAGRAVGVGVIATAVVSFVALMILVPTGLRMFGVAHLLYLVCTIAVPMLGVALAARSLTGDGLTRGIGLAAVLLVLPAAVGWHATHVAPFRLRVERVTVELAADRAGDDPVRIGVLADLQTADPGAHEQRAVDRLMAEEPDLILLPGDLFQGTPEAFARHEDEMRELIGRLHAPHGVYVVRGDVDHGDFVDRAVAGTDAVILDDKIVDVEVGDRTIRLGGNRLDYRSADAVAVRQELAEPTGPDGEDDGSIRIVVAHRPDAVLDLPEGSRVDLTVAGHTHGGQIAIPGVGPLVTLSDVPRRVGAGGLHRVDGNPIYVSTGVGMERAQAPQIRFFVPPSIGILTLR